MAVLSLTFINFTGIEGTWASLKSYDISIVREWINQRGIFSKGFSLNKGQVNKEVLLYSRNSGLNIFLTEKGLSFVIYSPKETESKKEQPKIQYSRVDYELIGGNIKKENIIFEEEIENYYENYYTPYAPDGILFVKLYKKVRIKDVYPGIDWILRYDNEGRFHHEFEALPNSEIAKIKIKVKNAQIELSDEGKSVLLKTPIGIIKDGNLIAYEGNRELSAKYILKDKLLSFDIRDYENREKILIDPALVWATYYGGSSYDYSNFNFN